MSVAAQQRSASITPRLSPSDLPCRCQRVYLYSAARIPGWALPINGIAMRSFRFIQQEAWTWNLTSRYFASLSGARYFSCARLAVVRAVVCYQRTGIGRV